MINRAKGAAQLNRAQSGGTCCVWKNAPALDSGASAARRGGERWTPRAQRSSAALGSSASSAQRWGRMVAPTPLGEAAIRWRGRWHPAFGELRILRMFAAAQA
jgi:hypothetical protein